MIKTICAPGRHVNFLIEAGYYNELTSNIDRSWIIHSHPVEVVDGQVPHVVRKPNPWHVRGIDEHGNSICDPGGPYKSSQTIPKVEQSNEIE